MNGFWMRFLLILAPFWYDFLTFLLVNFTCFSDSFFQASRTMFYQIFILGGISCFFGEPSLTRILLHENYGLRGYTFFKKHFFFRETTLGKLSNFRSKSVPFPHCFYIKFHDLFSMDVRIDLLIDI